MDDLDNKEIFTLVYKGNRWGSEETVSGPGSAIGSAAVHAAIDALKKATEELHINSINDIPCGDFNWMPIFLNQASNIKYSGFDIVTELVEANKQKFPQYSFYEMDATKHAPPKADLIFCKDLMSHLKSQDIGGLLSNFKKSGSRYLLATREISETNSELNDGELGGYRTVNLFAPPYSFPEALWDLGYYALWDLDAIDSKFFDTMADRINHEAERVLKSRLKHLEYRIAELETELHSRPAYGTEQFQLMAAERRRDHMRAVQPHLPISTAGVFSYSQHQQELFALEHLNFKRNGFFVEIGVATGREYSNTYLLESILGGQEFFVSPIQFTPMR